VSPPFAAPSLAESLSAYADELRASGSPFASEYDRLIDRLKAGSLGEHAPGLGEAMPPFMLPDQDGRIVTLESLLAEGPLVVSFNRGHWCPFCRIELEAFDRAHAELVALGARVVSIMPDRQPYTRELAARFRNPLTILSDIDNDYALALGLAMWVGTDIKNLLVEDGTMLPHFQGSSAWVLPLPATFVLRRDGRVAARYVNPDFRERMEIMDVLAALRALG
jgi:peroxiredoxin